VLGRGWEKGRRHIINLKNLTGKEGWFTPLLVLIRVNSWIGLVRAVTDDPRIHTN